MRLGQCLTSLSSIGWGSTGESRLFRGAHCWLRPTKSSRNMVRSWFWRTTDCWPLLLDKQCWNRRNLPFSPDFIYDDVALLEGQYLVAYQGEKETVLDERLNVVVPLDNHRIVRRFGRSPTAADHWLVKKTKATQQVVHDTLVTQQQVSYALYPLASDTLRWQKASYNDHWLALKNEDIFFLTDYQETDRTTAVYDSVQILGEHFALAFEGLGTKRDSAVVLSDQGVRRAFSWSEVNGSIHPSFRLLRTEGVVSPEQLHEYLLVDPGNTPPKSSIHEAR